MGGPFVSLIKAQAIGYQQRLDRLIDRRVSLNSEFFALQNKMQLIRTGLETATKEPIALVTIVNALLFLMRDVTYTCKECQHYSTKPAEGAPDLESLPPDQRRAEQARQEEARKRAQAFRDSFDAKGGYCIYRSSNIPTTTGRSCNDVWGLVRNDFWRASGDAQNGRIDILTKAKDKLDPRKT